MNDSESPKPFDFQAWQEFELKIREFYSRLFIETTKQSVEFAKLIVTNLIWVNAAGLGSLPVISRLAGVDGAPWSQITQVLLAPAEYFAAGMLFALMCSLTIYLNFYKMAMQAGANCDAEVNAMRQGNVALISHPSAKTLVQDQLSNSISEAERHAFWVKFYFWSAFVTGIFSFGFFSWACLELVNIHPTAFK